MNRENTIIDQAEKIFWDYISDKNIHSSEVISIATRNVESYLQHEVLSVEWIKNNIEVSENKITKVIELMNIIFIENQYKLFAAIPTFRYTIPLIRISFLGLIGNILGSFGGYQVFTLFNVDSFIGLCIGSLLGTFIFVLLSLKISLSSKVKIRLLFFFRGKEIFNKADYSDLLHKNIENWLFHVKLICKLIVKNIAMESAKEKSSVELFIIDELNKIKTLEDSKDIEREISFIFQYLNKNGVSSFDSSNSVWSEKMSLYYEPYGIIEDGDEFCVEEQAIIENSVVIKKGIARKIRK